jgi:hypothetical protein
MERDAGRGVGSGVGSGVDRGVGVTEPDKRPHPEKNGSVVSKTAAVIARRTLEMGPPVINTDPRRLPGTVS